MDECKPLVQGFELESVVGVSKRKVGLRVRCPSYGGGGGGVGRGLHSSTFQLNVSAFCDRGCI